MLYRGAFFLLLCDEGYVVWGSAEKHRTRSCLQTARACSPGRHVRRALLRWACPKLLLRRFCIAQLSKRLAQMQFAWAPTRASYSPRPTRREGFFWITLLVKNFLPRKKRSTRPYRTETRNGQLAYLLFANSGNQRRTQLGNSEILTYPSRRSFNVVVKA